MSKRFYTEEATLAKHPVNGVVGPDEWIDIFTEVGYYRETWLHSAAPSPTGRTLTARPRPRRS